MKSVILASIVHVLSIFTCDYLVVWTCIKKKWYLFFVCCIFCDTHFRPDYQPDMHTINQHQRVVFLKCHLCGYLLVYLTHAFLIAKLRYVLNKYQLNDICNVWIPVYYSYYEYTLWQLWIQIGFLFVISEQSNHRLIIFEKKDGRWEVKAWETMENQRSWWTKENQCTQKQYT